MLIINGAVGPNAPNAAEDVQVIQSALNTVPVALGGPSTPLTSGVIDDDTLAAILAFQQARYFNSDGRVDPRGRTLRDLSTYSDADANDPADSKPEVFCDVHVQAGTGPCGSDMMGRLRLVEAALRDQWPRDQNFSSWHGIVSLNGHQGRSDPIPIGKAVDLNADTNPYIVTRTGSTFGGEGSTLSQSRRARVAEAFDRAMSFGGPGRAADIRTRRPGESTADVYLRFHALSSSLMSYMSFAILPSGPSSVRRPVVPDAENADYDTLLEAIPADGPLAERWDVDTAVQDLTDFLTRFPVPLPFPFAGIDAFRAWHAQILRDYELIRIPFVSGPASVNPAKTRNPVNGFMDLRREVVEAMCNSARGNLIWGACDLGDRASGDMMHFET
jgi:hypothetical protein